MVPLFVFVALFGLGLSGCFDSSGGSGGSDSGDVVIGLTDAASNFVKYEVDVVSLTLTKQNGAVVEALPLATRVDFAQYVEMTEFLTVATIPVGRYVKATMTLNYDNAEIVAEDDNGDHVVVDNRTSIHDEDGNRIITQAVAVHLEGRNALVIAPGVPVHLTLDFDLGASNQVDWTNLADPVLTVRPTLLADVNPENPKIHRLRGPLKSVSVANGLFRMVICPFIHVISGADERFGTLQVITNAATIFDINRDRYQGAAGLLALEQQQVLTAVIVLGDLDITTRKFRATQVYAGSSVPGGTLDVVTGNIVSRSENQLTVKGATLVRAGGSVVFNDEVIIQIGPATTVNRQLSKDSFSTADISVGQRIMVFGELNSGEDELDATAGHVGLLLTTLKGTVVSSSDSAVVVKLTAIDGRKADLFDFNGTGAVTDADPDNYQVEMGSLAISGLEANDPVKLRGFVTQFGHAFSVADFESRTLVNVAEVKGLMIATWQPPASNAITHLSVDNFRLDLSGAVIFHHLNRAGVVTDLKALRESPIIEPQDSDKGLFQIVRNGSRQFFFTYTDFAEQLALLLTDSSVTHFIATGVFDDTNSILTTDFATVGLE
jgi:hypothetical protein